MEMTDREVIREVLDGKIDKFELLVNRYATKIQSYIRTRLFDKSELDDIVQSSFIQFYKALPQFDQRKPVYPYLLQIARNELYMYFRKNHSTVPLNEEITQTQGYEKSSEDIVDIMEGLKPEHKKALLWFAEGYSYREIAKRLNKPLNTVRTLIRRARLYIQKKYTHEK
jgi:RNA polymerase sigma-70 factor (ECF subfamily)